MGRFGVQLKLCVASWCVILVGKLKIGKVLFVSHCPHLASRMCVFKRLLDFNVAELPLPCKHEVSGH